MSIFRHDSMGYAAIMKLISSHIIIYDINRRSQVDALY